MKTAITKEKLHKYFTVTQQAYTKAQHATQKVNLENAREDFLDMIQRYISDARHFEQQGDIVTAFAALNYAHGWLDAGARLGLWNVNDNTLFTVDE